MEKLFCFWSSDGLECVNTFFPHPPQDRDGEGPGLPDVLLRIRRGVGGRVEGSGPKAGERDSKHGRHRARSQEGERAHM